MKLGTQVVPPPEGLTDVSNKRYVDQLGGSGAPDLIHCTMSGDQNITGTNVVTFDTVGTSRGMTNDGTNKVSGLKAGRTYYIQANLAIFYTVSAVVTFEIWDVTAGARIGVINRVNTTTDAGHNSSSTVLSYPFTPTQDTELQVRVVSAIVGNDIDSVYSWFSVIEVSGTPLHGGMEHLETITHSGAAVQSLTFNGLSGEDDEVYFLDVYWVPPATSGSNLELRPNGVSTGQNTVWNYGINTSGSTNESASLLLARTDTATCLSLYSRAWLTARTAEYKMLLADESIHTSAGNVTRRGISGVWNDNSTLITSLEVRAVSATGILAGTRISLYRLRAENGAIPTLDKVNVYQAAQTVAKHDLGTASGNVAIDASLSNTFDLTVNGATTILAPTNLEDGQSIIIRVRQDGTGSRDVTFNAAWDFGDETAPDTSADAAETLMIVSGSSDGTNIFCSGKKGFTNT